ncbi:recombinase family protein [Micromonospora chokoriensis]
MTTPDLMRPYLRVSDSKSGTSRSTSEQAVELEVDAGGHAWQLGPAYLDEGKSASRHAKKARDDFGRLMADLGSGAFGASILGLWEGSRGSRQVGEWVGLLAALEQARVRVWISTEERLFDPTIPGDRKALLTMAVDAEHESAKTRQRVLRSAASSAAAGRPWGVCPYGYRRVFDPRTGEFVEQVEHPEEAENVRDLFNKLHAGWSFGAIARAWAARGVLAGTGRPFTPTHLRQVAIKQAYAGRRVHHGKTTEAVWDPIVKPALFDEVQTILRNPARKTTRSGLGVHLATAVVRCGVCGGPTSSAERGGEPRHLRCHDFDHVQINQAFVDELIEEAIIDALGDRELTRRPAGQDERLDRVRAELAAVRLQLVDLAAAVAGRKLSITLAASAEPPLLAEEARLEAAERELSVPPRLSRFAAPSDAAVRQRWYDSPMSARRDAARDLCVPGRLGVPTIGRIKDRSWCSAREHEQPVQLCIHTVARRLTWEQRAAV